MNTDFINTLRDRFEKHFHRHKDMSWGEVEKKIKNSAKLSILERMESTGGEVDVVGFDAETHEYIFMDCSRESPAVRRSLCYDQAALDARKENKPRDFVISMVNAIGATLLTEDDYRYLQSLEEFDLKTSSWIATPPDIRKLGGALFCDKRYDTIFTYHNGADSYYAARGWRGSVRI
ncbi:DUF4256 domain-containing protein [Candidatus Gracilibacteria bacterium]|nr:DUF4256 domain-containing protein [Candidatus Gracilibacteria bacterium]